MEPAGELESHDQYAEFQNSMFLLSTYMNYIPTNNYNDIKKI